MIYYVMYYIIYTNQAICIVQLVNISTHASELRALQKKQINKFIGIKINSFTYHDTKGALKKCKEALLRQLKTCRY